MCSPCPDRSLVGSSALTLALVIAGIILLSFGAIYESGIFGSTRLFGLSLGADPKHALLAPRLLRTPTTGMYSHVQCLTTCAHLIARNNIGLLLFSDHVFQRGYILPSALLSSKPCSKVHPTTVLRLLQAVHGSSALHAGLQLLPYTLGSSLVSLVAFYVSGKTKAYNAMIRVGLGLMATGFGVYPRAR